MKIPRDLAGSDLAKALRELGYETIRQTASHARLTLLWTASIISA
jgi:predicted RNA binding protein YcfA (HicA-like mRNA interferase family)